MRTLIRHLVGSALRLTGRGAADNARREVDRNTRSIVELDRQLGRVGSPPPGQAA